MIVYDQRYSSSMKEVLIVGLGGFAGSISRYLIQNAVVNRFITIFPLGTFAINIINGRPNKFYYQPQKVENY